MPSNLIKLPPKLYRVADGKSLTLINGAYYKFEPIESHSPRFFSYEQLMGGEYAGKFSENDPNYVRAKDSSIPGWDEFFMRHAYLASTKSKDTRTKIGAVIVKQNRVISEGYNGMPERVDDNIDSRYERPEKYFYFEHGERNAIYSCARHGIATLGASMFTQGIPCADCARGVIQAGITEVVVHSKWHSYEGHDKWADSAKRSMEMFNEAGVVVKKFVKELGLKSLLNGNTISI